MRKSCMLFIIIAFTQFSSKAQLGFTQSASGQSALLSRGANIGLNLTDASLSFGINNLDRQLGKSKGFIFGASASGKNAEGLGGIFDGGDFVADAKIEGFLGMSFSNGEKILRNVSSVEKDLRKEIEDEIESFDASFATTFIDILSSEAETIKDNNKRKRFVDKITDGFTNSKRRVQFINKLSSEDNETEEVIENIQKKVKPILAEHDKKLEAMNSSLEKRNKAYFDTAFYMYSNVFLLGGINGSDFKRFTTLDSIDYSKSFKDEHFRGGYFGIGTNLQVRDWYFGATYTYKLTNNFDLLTKKEYSWKRVNTSGNQSLTEDKKITAYSDVYDVIEVNELSVDLTYNLKLDSASKYHMLINPYYRGMMFTRNNTLLPNKSTVGAGVYFFNNNSKFLGGLYVELADVNQNYEKMKPLAEQNLRKPLNRLSFGITTKFSINTLRNTFRVTDESDK